LKALLNGGGGIRTPVPECFKTGIYILSRNLVLSPSRLATDGTGKRNMQAVFNEPDKLGIRIEDDILVTGDGCIILSRVPQ
jgi:Xaa-Pro aminopeptidase